MKATTTYHSPLPDASETPLTTAERLLIVRALDIAAKQYTRDQAATLVVSRRVAEAFAKQAAASTELGVRIGEAHAIILVEDQERTGP